jgi:hypothetical protein
LRSFALADHDHLIRIADSKEEPKQESTEHEHTEQKEQAEQTEQQAEEEAIHQRFSNTNTAVS